MKYHNLVLVAICIVLHFALVSGQETTTNEPLPADEISTTIDCNGKSFYCLDTNRYRMCTEIGGAWQTGENTVQDCATGTYCLNDGPYACSANVSYIVDAGDAETESYATVTDTIPENHGTEPTVEYETNTATVLPSNTVGVTINVPKETTAGYLTETIEDKSPSTSGPTEASTSGPKLETTTSQIVSTTVGNPPEMSSIPDDTTTISGQNVETFELIEPDKSQTLTEESTGTGAEGDLTTVTSDVNENSIDQGTDNGNSLTTINSSADEEITTQSALTGSVSTGTATTNPSENNIEQTEADQLSNGATISPTNLEEISTEDITVNSPVETTAGSNTADLSSSILTTISPHSNSEPIGLDSVPQLNSATTVNANADADISTLPAGLVPMNSETEKPLQSAVTQSELAAQGGDTSDSVSVTTISSNSNTESIRLDAEPQLNSATMGNTNAEISTQASGLSPDIEIETENPLENSVGQSEPEKDVTTQANSASASGSPPAEGDISEVSSSILTTVSSDSNGEAVSLDLEPQLNSAATVNADADISTSSPGLAAMNSETEKPLQNTVAQSEPENDLTTQATSNADAEISTQPSRLSPDNALETENPLQKRVSQTEPEKDATTQATSGSAGGSPAAEGDISEVSSSILTTIASNSNGEANLDLGPQVNGATTDNTNADKELSTQSAALPELVPMNTETALPLQNNDGQTKPQAEMTTQVAEDTMISSTTITSNADKELSTGPAIIESEAAPVNTQTDKGTVNNAAATEESTDSSPAVTTSRPFTIDGYISDLLSSILTTISPIFYSEPVEQVQQATSETALDTNADEELMTQSSSGQPLDSESENLVQTNGLQSNTETTLGNIVDKDITPQPAVVQPEPVDNDTANPVQVQPISTNAGEELQTQSAVSQPESVDNKTPATTLDTNAEIVSSAESAITQSDSINNSDLGQTDSPTNLVENSSTGTDVLASIDASAVEPANIPQPAITTGSPPAEQNSENKSEGAVPNSDISSTGNANAAIEVVTASIPIQSVDVDQPESGSDSTTGYDSDSANSPTTSTITPIADDQNADNVVSTDDGNSDFGIPGTTNNIAGLSDTGDSNSSVNVDGSNSSDATVNISEQTIGPESDKSPGTVMPISDLGVIAAYPQAADTENPIEEPIATDDISMVPTAESTRPGPGMIPITETNNLLEQESLSSTPVAQQSIDKPTPTNSNDVTAIASNQAIDIDPEASGNINLESAGITESGSGSGSLANTQEEPTTANENVVPVEVEGSANADALQQSELSPEGSSLTEINQVQGSATTATEAQQVTQDTGKIDDTESTGESQAVGTDTANNSYQPISPGIQIADSGAQQTTQTDEATPDSNSVTTPNENTEQVSTNTLPDASAIPASQDAGKVDSENGALQSIENTELSTAGVQSEQLILPSSQDVGKDGDEVTVEPNSASQSGASTIMQPAQEAESNGSAVTENTDQAITFEPTMSSDPSVQVAESAPFDQSTKPQSQEADKGSSGTQSQPSQAGDSTDKQPLQPVPASDQNSSPVVSSVPSTDNPEIDSTDAQSDPSSTNQVTEQVASETEAELGQGTESGPNDLPPQDAEGSGSQTKPGELGQEQTGSLIETNSAIDDNGVPETADDGIQSVAPSTTSPDQAIQELESHLATESNNVLGLSTEKPPMQTTQETAATTAITDKTEDGTPNTTSNTNSLPSDQSELQAGQSASNSGSGSLISSEGSETSGTINQSSALDTAGAVNSDANLLTNAEGSQIVQGNLENVAQPGSTANVQMDQGGSPISVPMSNNAGSSTNLDSQTETSLPIETETNQLGNQEGSAAEINSGLSTDDPTAGFDVNQNSLPEDLAANNQAAQVVESEIGSLPESAQSSGPHTSPSTDGPSQLSSETINNPPSGINQDTETQPPLTISEAEAPAESQMSATTIDPSRTDSEVANDNTATGVNPDSPSDNQSTQQQTSPGASTANNGALSSEIEMESQQQIGGDPILSGSGIQNEVSVNKSQSIVQSSTNEKPLPIDVSENGQDGGSSPIPSTETSQQGVLEVNGNTGSSSVVLGENNVVQTEVSGVETQSSGTVGAGDEIIAQNTVLPQEQGIESQTTSTANGGTISSASESNPVSTQETKPTDDTSVNQPIDNETQGSDVLSETSQDIRTGNAPVDSQTLPSENQGTEPSILTENNQLTSDFGATESETANIDVQSEAETEQPQKPTDLSPGAPTENVVSGVQAVDGEAETIASDTEGSATQGVLTANIQPSQSETIDNAIQSGTNSQQTPGLIEGGQTANNPSVTQQIGNESQGGGALSQTGQDASNANASPGSQISQIVNEGAEPIENVSLNPAANGQFAGEIGANQVQIVNGDVPSGSQTEQGQADQMGMPIASEKPEAGSQTIGSDGAGAQSGTVNVDPLIDNQTSQITNEGSGPMGTDQFVGQISSSLPNTETIGSGSQGDDVLSQTGPDTSTGSLSVDSQTSQNASAGTGPSETEAQNPTPLGQNVGQMGASAENSNIGSNGAEQSLGQFNVNEQTLPSAGLPVSQPTGNEPQESNLLNQASSDPSSINSQTIQTANEGTMAIGIESQNPTENVSENGASATIYNDIQGVTNVEQDLPGQGPSTATNPPGSQSIGSESQGGDLLSETSPNTSNLLIDSQTSQNESEGTGPTGAETPNPIANVGQIGSSASNIDLESGSELSQGQADLTSPLVESPVNQPIENEPQDSNVLSEASSNPSSIDSQTIQNANEGTKPTGIESGTPTVGNLPGSEPQAGDVLSQTSQDSSSSIPSTNTNSGIGSIETESQNSNGNDVTLGQIVASESETVVSDIQSGAIPEQLDGQTVPNQETQTSVDQLPVSHPIENGAQEGDVTNSNPVANGQSIGQTGAIGSETVSNGVQSGADAEQSQDQAVSSQGTAAEQPIENETQSETVLSQTIPTTSNSNTGNLQGSTIDSQTIQNTNQETGPIDLETDLPQPNSENGQTGAQADAVHSVTESLQPVNEASGTLSDQSTNGANIPDQVVNEASSTTAPSFVVVPSKPPVNAAVNEINGETGITHPTVQNETAGNGNIAEAPISPSQTSSANGVTPSAQKTSQEIIDQSGWSIQGPSENELQSATPYPDKLDQSMVIGVGVVATSESTGEAQDVSTNISNESDENPSTSSSVGSVLNQNLPTQETESNESNEGADTDKPVGIDSTKENIENSEAISNTPLTPQNQNQFVCVNSGRFPDPYDCSKYHLCLSSKTGYYNWNRTCTDGTVFSRASLRCTDDRTQCTIAGASQFTCFRSGRYPDLSDPKKYYLCVSNSNNVFRKFHLKCTEDSEFSVRHNRCNRIQTRTSHKHNDRRSTEENRKEASASATETNNRKPHHDHVQHPRHHDELQSNEHRKHSSEETETEEENVSKEHEEHSRHHNDRNEQSTEQHRKHSSEEMKSEDNAEETNRNHRQNKQNHRQRNDNEDNGKKDSSEEIEFKCVEEGRFADPKDDQKFYYCTQRNKTKNKFRKKHFRCDKEHRFDADDGKCVKKD